MTKQQRDRAEWDAEIEEEFQRAVAAGKAAAKRKRDNAFAKVPLGWIEAAARHTRSPATMVLMELLYRSWQAKSLTFPLPNTRLSQWGVSRKTKARVLRDLERGGLLRVERRERKSPIVTLKKL